MGIERTKLRVFMSKTVGMVSHQISEDKRMASRLIRNQLPLTGLWVRVPCPPLLVLRHGLSERQASELLSVNE